MFIETFVGTKCDPLVFETIDHLRAFMYRLRANVNRLPGNNANISMPLRIHVHVSLRARPQMRPLYTALHKDPGSSCYILLILNLFILSYQVKQHDRDRTCTKRQLYNDCMLLSASAGARKTTSARCTGRRHQKLRRQERGICAAMQFRTPAACRHTDRDRRIAEGRTDGLGEPR